MKSFGNMWNHGRTRWIAALQAVVLVAAAAHIGGCTASVNDELGTSAQVEKGFALPLAIPVGKFIIIPLGKIVHGVVVTTIMVVVSHYAAKGAVQLVRASLADAKKALSNVRVDSLPTLKLPQSLTNVMDIPAVTAHQMSQMQVALAPEQPTNAGTKLGTTPSACRQCSYTDGRWIYTIQSLISVKASYVCAQALKWCTSQGNGPCTHRTFTVSPSADPTCLPEKVLAISPNYFLELGSSLGKGFKFH